MHWAKNKLYIFSLIALALGCLLIICCYFVAIKYEIPFIELTADPATIHSAHPFTGIISNLGIVLWTIAMSVSLLSGAILTTAGNTKKGKFLILIGMMTAILMLDDLFMMHDYLFVDFEIVFYLIYAVFVAVLFIKYYRLILKNNYSFLVAAVIFLGLSVVLDITMENSGIQYLFEDGLKFLGILSWTLFLINTSYTMLRESTSSPDLRPKTD